jgi:hypothetical protein
MEGRTFALEDMESWKNQRFLTGITVYVRYHDFAYQDSQKVRNFTGTIEDSCKLPTEMTLALSARDPYRPCS